MAFGDKVIDCQDLKGKAQCGQKHQEIALIEGGDGAMETKEIEAHHAHQNGDPDLFMDGLMQKPRADGDKDHIEGGDKAGFGRGCIGNAKLLEDGAYKKAHATTNGSND